MKRNNASNGYSYLKEYNSLYVYTVGLFIMGLVFGSLILKSLSLTQEQELMTYLSDFFYDISIGEWQSAKIAFWQILFDNLKYLLIIWFLGLSIIGMPLIFLLIFIKGFVVGFTISILITELSWRGFIFSLVSIFPQNLIVVPVFIIAGVAGTLFSLSLIRGRVKLKSTSYQQSFFSYSFLMLILSGVIIVASAFEAFVSPYLMKGVTAFLIQ